ncbi:COP9 signalosome (CSN) subunit [Serendipita sp. 407]|nr:COP9 signalosome (CSN) subunit [Serendipita sp. 407]
MKLENLAHHINLCVKANNGIKLASWLSTNEPDHVDALRKANIGSTRDSLSKKYMNKFASPWDEICIAHLLAVIAISENRMEDAYKEQASMVNAFLRFFGVQTNWVLTPLWVVLTELRQLAHDGDVELYNQQKLTTCCEDAARICNKAFTMCVTDRTSQPAESRKWGVYRAVNIVLKCYFKVNRTNLSKNVIRAIEANSDIPSLEQFEMTDQVTYRYYQGLLALLDENYSRAEGELSFAFEHCHYSSPRNQERILTFLIPLRMMKGSFPTVRLLKRFPSLEGLYGRFLKSIREGNIVEFDRALLDLEARLVQLNIWLMIVKVREITVSRVFRKCWLVLNKPSRVSIPAFHAALKVAGNHSDALSYYVQHYAQVKARPEDCLMVGITNKEMDIEVLSNKSKEKEMVHIPLDPPLMNAKEARARLVNMTWEAIEGLGMSRYQVNTYQFDVQQAFTIFACLCMYYVFLAPKEYIPYEPFFASIDPFFKIFCMSLPVFAHTLENQLFMVPLLKKHRVRSRKLRSKWIFACLVSGGPAIARFKKLVAQEKQRLDEEMKKL